MPDLPKKLPPFNLAPWTGREFDVVQTDPCGVAERDLPPSAMRMSMTDLVVRFINVMSDETREVLWAKIDKLYCRLCRNPIEEDERCTCAMDE